MKQVKLFLATLALVATFSANAQDENNPWAIGLGVNVVDVRHYTTDMGVNFEDYIGPKDWNVLPALSRITVGRYLDHGLSLQLAGSLNKIESLIDKDDSDRTYYSIDAMLNYDLNNLFGETGWFDPYIGLGADFHSLSDIDNSAGTGTGLGVGGEWGFNVWFNENIGLNFNSAYKHQFKQQGADVFQHYVGLVFKFGGSDTDGDGIFDKNDACPEVKGIPEFNGCPDTDGDGIVDSKDACPEVAGLAQLNGCPDTDGDGIADKNDACPDVKGSKAHKGCPDTDGDGIVDKDDKCPKVPGLKSRQGCPVKDTDGDGIEDSKDKCPKVAGPASNNGCPGVSEEHAATLKHLFESVYFNTGKYTFMPATYEILNSAAAIITKYPTARFSISGYTDSVGNDRRNLTLSQNRANAVKNYLVTKGVPAANLTATGYGESSPIASNRTKAGRAKNRRVEIRLVK